jgi:hypothetical protein
MSERLFRVWHTVLEMLGDRGYLVAPTLLALDEASFLELHGCVGDAASLTQLRTAMTLHMLHGGESRDRDIRVLFLDRPSLGGAEKIGKPLVATLMQRLGEGREGRETQGLFILSDDLGVTPTARKTFEAMCDEQPGIVQWFREEELVVNCVRIEKDRGVRYTHLSKGSRTLTQPEGVLRNLARDYVVSRVSRYFNAQANDIMCIERRSDSSGLTKSYRRCARVIHADDVKDMIY